MEGKVFTDCAVSLALIVSLEIFQQYLSIVIGDVTFRDADVWKSETQLIHSSQARSSRNPLLRPGQS